MPKTARDDVQVTGGRQFPTVRQISSFAIGALFGYSAARLWRRQGPSLARVPASVYRFDLSALEPGDILLSTIPLSKSSLFIRRVTGSEVSHAAIYSGNGRMLEAHRKPGVTRASLKNAYIRCPRSIHVRRLKANIPDHRAIRDRAVVAAEEYYAAYYSLGGAALSVLRWLPSWTGRRVFCSQLVAAAFRKGGADLTPGLAPNKVVPEDLLRSTLRQDIANSVLIPVDAPLLPHTMIDERQNATAHHKEVALEQDVIHQLNRLLPKSYRSSVASLLATCESLAEYCIQNPGSRERLDRSAMSILSNSKLLDWYSCNPPDQEIFEAIEARARELSAATGSSSVLPPDIEAWLRNAYHGMPEDVRYRLQALNDYTLLENISGLKSIGQVVRSYKAFVDRMSGRQTTIELLLRVDR